jgi:hypothetical protein
MQGLISSSGGINIDGNNNAGDPGGGTPGRNMLIGNGIGGFLDGRFVEGGTIPSNASSHFRALNSNQHSF